MTARNILIIGAGIGGLTTALSFARAGHEVHLAEQAPVLSEVGAGLQVSPNASRILISLGLGDALHEAMVFPHEIVLASGGSLRKLTHVPCGAFAAERWGAPYGVMHRADLQALLLDAVSALPNCHLHLGQRISSADMGELVGRLGLPRPDLVVGADGVWSEVRRQIKGAPPPRFSGQVAWRFKLQTDAARSVLNPASVTAFLGSRTHLVAYPLAKAKAFNMVAITRGNDPGQTWAQREQPDRRQDLLDAFSGWHRDLLSLLRQAPEMTRWPLYEVPDGTWHDGANTILIGDAAHAMTPFAAQGAAMAIEDGYELSQACTAVDGDLAATLESYQAKRRARVSRTRSRGAFNQFAYHARGPIRLGRDVVLALRQPENLAAELDWLYGYRASGL